MKDMDQQNQALFNLEAEQQLIGSLLMDNEGYHRCSDLIGPDQFYNALHGEIWRVSGRRIETGESVSPVILSTLMGQNTEFQEAGGGKYLASLMASAISSSFARDYAKMLSGMWQRRTVVDALQEASEGVLGGGEVSDALKVISAVSEALSVSDGRPSSISYLKALTQAVGEMQSAVQTGASGVSTGIKDLDRLTGPLRGGDMLVLGGAPSMGKTSLALAIADKVADQGVGVGLVSLEMTGESLAFRALGAASDVPYEQIIEGNLNEAEGRAVAEGAQRIKDRPVDIVQPHIKDLHAINAALVRIRAKLEQRGTPLGLVLIDYLQLVRAPGKDRYSIVSAVSSGIKSMAMQMNVPIIALSQLSRGLMDRDDKRPRMSDLRESGQIEQDADLILFTHREEYYLQRERPPSSIKGLDTQSRKEKETAAMADFEAALSVSRNKMEVICAKRRMGRIGAVTLGCDVATNRIWSLSEDRNQEVMF